MDLEVVSVLLLRIFLLNQGGDLWRFGLVEIYVQRFQDCLEVVDHLGVRASDGTSRLSW